MLCSCHERPGDQEGWREQRPWSARAVVLMSFFPPPPRVQSFVSDSKVLKKREPLSSSVGQGLADLNSPEVCVCTWSWVGTCPGDRCCFCKCHIEINGGRRGPGLPPPPQSRVPWVLWRPQSPFASERSLGILRPATAFSQLSR